MGVVDIEITGEAVAAGAVAKTSTMTTSTVIETMDAVVDETMVIVGVALEAAGEDSRVSAQQQKLKPKPHTKLSQTKTTDIITTVEEALRVGTETTVEVEGVVGVDEDEAVDAAGVDAVGTRKVEDTTNRRDTRQRLRLARSRIRIYSWFLKTPPVDESGCRDMYPWHV